MSDIIERLRNEGDYDPSEDLVRDPVCRDAIDEIARLREQVGILSEECRQRRVMDRLAAYHHVAGPRQEFEDARAAMHACENRTDAAGPLRHTKEAGR